MLFSSQIRAARGLIEWSREDLARKAGLGLSTVQRMEKGAGLAQGTVANIWRLQQTLEAAGVVFVVADEGGGPFGRLKLTPVIDL